MKKVVLIVLCVLVVTNGFGWGVTGHRATGLIAEQYLTKKARKRIQQILLREFFNRSC